MKVLISAGVAPSTVFSHVPLANALRNAGHEVMTTASLDEMLPVINSVGLTAFFYRGASACGGAHVAP